MPKKRDLKCCLGCGRDTTGTYCPRCLGKEPKTNGGRAERWTDATAEDRYDEESGPDDVYMEGEGRLRPTEGTLT